jgi:hypothetical protein
MPYPLARHLPEFIVTGPGRSAASSICPRRPVRVLEARGRIGPWGLTRCSPVPLYAAPCMGRRRKYTLFLVFFWIF